MGDERLVSIADWQYISLCYNTTPDDYISRANLLSERERTTLQANKIKFHTTFAADFHSAIGQAQFKIASTF